MCGIVGIVSSRGRIGPQVLRAAADTLALRGPDDVGVWCCEEVGLGHRRLAIIDVSPSGHQPMLSADGRFVIVFNGEIYNFLELRQELDEVGRRWQSRSDSEVILAAYAKWGHECVRRLRGMFAFAIWDQQERALFAARDRLGVKPLYYQHSAEGFAFASRPRAILAVQPECSCKIDEQALRLYLESGYVPAPYSIFQSIRKLPPGHWLLLERGRVRLQRYWDFRGITPEPGWETRREEDLLDELDELVARSVKWRMVSDVPLGAFLSGGIDSSLVVAMMARHSSSPVKTFTIGFAEEQYDESDHARAISECLNTEHLCERLQIADLLELLPAYTREFDEPFFDYSAMPTMLVSRMARKFVKVSLSGDGGDELFGGYPYYRMIDALAPFYRWSKPVRQVGSVFAGAIPRHRFQLLASALRQNSDVEGFAFARGIAKDFGLALSPDILARTFSMRELFCEAAAAFPPGLQASEKAMRLDLLYTLPDDYLQKLDVASMAFSLESRDPLLDHDLVEWAMRLPLKWKLHNGRNKYLLRELACRYVPRQTLDRPKHGFEVPMAEWLRTNLRDWALARFENSEAFRCLPLNQAHILALFRIHCSGKRQAHPLLWAFLVLLDFSSTLRERGGVATCAVC